MKRPFLLELKMKSVNFITLTWTWVEIVRALAHETSDAEERLGTGRSVGDGAEGSNAELNLACVHQPLRSLHALLEAGLAAASPRHNMHLGLLHDT